MLCWGKCNSDKHGGLHQDCSALSPTVIPMKLLCSVLVTQNTFGCVCLLVLSFHVLLQTLRSYHLSCNFSVPTPFGYISAISLISTPTPYGGFHLGTCPLVECLQRLDQSQGFYTVNSYLCEPIQLTIDYLIFHLHCEFIPLLFSPSTLRILNALPHCAMDLTQDLGILGKGSTTEF